MKKELANDDRYFENSRKKMYGPIFKTPVFFKPKTVDSSMETTVKKLEKEKEESK
jgi:hypothetical protein